MARKVENIQTVQGRADLKARNAPYMLRLRKGCYVGYRKGKLGHAWVARIRMPDGRQEWNTDPGLACVANDAGGFDTAKKIAEAWFDSLGSMAVRSIIRGKTVYEALEAGIETYRIAGRHQTAKEKARVIRTCLSRDPIASMDFEHVTKNDVTEWRARITAGKRGKVISNATLNDYLRTTRTVVRKAINAGYAGNIAAWVVEGLGRPEGNLIKHFLDAEQRAALIANAHPALAVFLRGLQATGCRPSELAKATVADYSRKEGVLRLCSRKGNGGVVRDRDVTLGPAGRALFNEQARDKVGLALLFPSYCGRKWARTGWAQLFREAAAKCEAQGVQLFRGVRCYSFRHAYISELLQTHGFDVFAVAEQCGTSPTMIKRHYYRVTPTTRARLAQVG